MMLFTKIDINNWTRKEYFDHYVLFLLHTKISKNVLNLLKQSCQFSKQSDEQPYTK